MKKLYIMAIIAQLSLGQNILSSDKKPIFPESWYDKQFNHIMPYRCAQKCPGSKASCISKCIKDYAQEVDIYTMRQAIKDCIEGNKFNEEFTYIDREEDPKGHIEKVSNPFLEDFKLITNESIRECVRNKKNNEHALVKKMFEKKQGELTTGVKVKTCLNEFESEKPFLTAGEVVKCLKNNFINKK